MACLAALALLVAYGDWRVVAVGGGQHGRHRRRRRRPAPNLLMLGAVSPLRVAFNAGVTVVTAWSLIWLTAGVSRLFVTVNARTDKALTAAREADAANAAARDRPRRPRRRQRRAGRPEGRVGSRAGPGGRHA